jgi:dienelactone hydrolase
VDVNSNEYFAGTLCRVLLLSLMFGVLSACNAPIPIIDPRPDIELTWAEAGIALPPFRSGEEVLLANLEDNSVKDRLASLPRRAKLPVILYAHGCTGLGSGPLFKTLAKAGYVVIAPDSMARRYRPLQCDPKTQTGGYNRFVYDFRLTEISFALDRLKRLAWVDQQKIFLIGVSEGGVAAALYRGDEFRARVIAQWTCTGAPIVQGIFAPLDEPVLTIVRDADPWYDKKRTRRQRGDCGAFMQGRPNARSIILKGGDHNLLDEKDNVRTVLEFLEIYRR